MVRKPSFDSQKIFIINFVAFHETKPVLTLDKLIYIGCNILDLSKLLIYEFHYDYIGIKYGSGAKLLFIDTYSLVYEIETGDVYEDFYEDMSLFNYFNDFSKDSRIYDPVNKKVFGKMKDEVREKIIHEFVRLKSKMYSLVKVDGREIKKAKDVNKNNVGSKRHKEYVNVLFGRDFRRHDMKRIQSKLHRIGTYDVRKISLLCFDDKRYICDDAVGSFGLFL